MIQPLVEPGWYCEHCDSAVDGIADSAEVNETQKCPRCRKHAVVWMTPAQFHERLHGMNAACPTATVREDQAGANHPTPQSCRIRKQLAADWFARMRAAINTTTP